jgi:hypothetical protein
VLAQPNAVLQALSPAPEDQLVASSSFQDQMQTRGVLVSNERLPPAGTATITALVTDPTSSSPPADERRCQ